MSFPKKNRSKPLSGNLFFLLTDMEKRASIPQTLREFRLHDGRSNHSRYFPITAFLLILGFRNPSAISVSVMDSSREYFVLDKFVNIGCSFFFFDLSQAIKDNSFTLTNVFICRCQPVLSDIPSTDFLGDRTKQIDDDKRRLLTQKSRAMYGCTKMMFEVFSLIVREGLVSSKLVQ